MKKFLHGAIKIGLVAGFWLCVWYLLARRIGSDFLFPAPLTVWNTLWDLLREKMFWLTVSLSLLRIVWGILLSFILGAVLAYVTSVSRLLHALLSPLLAVAKATPVASFIILALLWLERDILPVFITALIVVPIVWANLSEGIRNVDENLKEVAHIYHFSVPQKVFRLYLPSIAPYFMAACKSSLGMAWKAGIAAEILATPDYSIGKELYFSKTYLETPTLFAWTLVVILFSILIEKLFVLVLEQAGRKRHLFRKGDRHAEN